MVEQSNNIEGLPQSVAGPSRRTLKVPALGQAPCHSVLAQLLDGTTSWMLACTTGSPTAAPVLLLHPRIHGLPITLIHVLSHILVLYTHVALVHADRKPN